MPQRVKPKPLKKVEPESDLPDTFNCKVCTFENNVNKKILDSAVCQICGTKDDSIAAKISAANKSDSPISFGAVQGDGPIFGSSPQNDWGSSNGFYQYDCDVCEEKTNWESKME